MISKELLSEMLEVNVTKDSNILDNATGVIYEVYGDKKNFVRVINIYELANKCKEWALRTHKYSIVIMYDVDIFRQDNLRFSVRIVTRDGVTKFKVKDIPEPEAIFKACEWILNDRR